MTCSSTWATPPGKHPIPSLDVVRAFSVPRDAEGPIDVDDAQIHPQTFRNFFVQRIPNPFYWGHHACRKDLRESLEDSLFQDKLHLPEALKATPSRKLSAKSRAREEAGVIMQGSSTKQRWTNVRVGLTMVSMSLWT